MSEEISLKDLKQKIDVDIKSSQKFKGLLDDRKERLMGLRKYLDEERTPLEDNVKRVALKLGIGEQATVSQISEQLKSLLDLIASHIAPATSNPESDTPLIRANTGLADRLQKLNSIALGLESLQSSLTTTLKQFNAAIKDLIEVSPKDSEFSKRLSEINELLPGKADFEQLRNLIYELNHVLTELTEDVLDSESALYGFLSRLGESNPVEPPNENTPIETLLESYFSLLNNVDRRLVALKDCLGDSYDAFRRAISGTADLSVEEALALLNKVRALPNEGICGQIKKIERVKVSL